MDGMESLLGQPVNAMTSFMGSSKFDRPDDVSGLKQFENYGNFGGSNPGIGDPLVNMFGNVPLNELGMPSGPTPNDSENNMGRLNDLRQDSNSINNMMMNPIGTPMSGSMSAQVDMPSNQMGTHVDSQSMGTNDSLPSGYMPPNTIGGREIHGMGHLGLANANMSGNALGKGLGPMSGMMSHGGINATIGGNGMNSIESGSIDPVNMMNHMGGMNVGNASGQFNNQMRGSISGNPAGVFSQGMANTNMPGMQMHMNNGDGKSPMGSQVGIRPGAVGQPPHFANGAADRMIAPQMIDQSQIPAAAMQRKRVPAVARKKSQPRSQPAKRATQTKTPRATKPPAKPQNQPSSGQVQSMTHSQQYIPYPVLSPQQLPQQQQLDHTQLNMEQSHEPPQDASIKQIHTPHDNIQNSLSRADPATPMLRQDNNSATTLPMRQFEFSSQQPPPPRAPGALKLRVHFVLLLNQELIKVSMSSASGSDVFKASMMRLESNLHYLHQIHLQQDIGSALAIAPPILGPITAIPSLSEPYKRLKDMFNFRMAS